jgi:hypothetical protein
MTSETLRDEAPEPEQTKPPAERGESPFEPFETEDFQGSDDFEGDRLDCPTSARGAVPLDRKR